MEAAQRVLDSYVAQGEDITKDKIGGASFIAVDKNGPRFTVSAGRVDNPTDSAKYDGDTVTLGASMTKLITSICFLQLLEQGLFTLDQDLGQLLPDLASLQILKGFGPDGRPILVDNTTPITPRMLLTHSSGVTYDWMDPEADKYRQFVGLPPQNDYKKVGLKLPLRFAPGEGWGYSASLDWLGLAMEKVVGMTMGEYMRTKIFEPLGMTRTTFDPDALATTPKSLAPVMYRGQDGTLTSGPSLIKYEERDYDSAGAGLYSTANDYAKVLHAILKKDVPGLSKDTYDLLFKPQLGDAAKSHLAALSEPLNDLLWPDFPPGMPADHSLAAMINEKDIPGRRSAGSIKWLGAASTHWWLDPKAGIAGAFFTSVFPIKDDAVVAAYDGLERAVYASL